MIIDKKSLLLLIVVLGGCAAITRHTLNDEYGAPDPARFDVPAAPPAGFSYRSDVQPILEKRCVVCHACYDGPCQLKFTAWEGVARGREDGPPHFTLRSQRQRGRPAIYTAARG